MLLGVLIVAGTSAGMGILLLKVFHLVENPGRMLIALWIAVIIVISLWSCVKYTRHKEKGNNK